MFFNGYHGDLNETFFVGNVDEKSKKLVRASWECLDLAIKEGRLYRVKMVLKCLSLKIKANRVVWWHSGRASDGKLRYWV